ncbi:hypothetical protein C2G38_2125613 [Gigaspora rosea]|uniref:Uncharacterized protein n=1 Tax=Gigaspora rosea TaxID=44941 RepID=A0A397TZN8_9GLOM|nr:hypothetical protein C2G38_2125613 [Gigaspora rosea]
MLELWLSVAIYWSSHYLVLSFISNSEFIHRRLYVGSALIRRATSIFLRMLVSSYFVIVSVTLLIILHCHFGVTANVVYGHYFFFLFCIFHSLYSLLIACLFTAGLIYLFSISLVLSYIGVVTWWCRCILVMEIPFI